MNRRSDLEMSGDRIMKNMKGMAGGAEELAMAAGVLLGYLSRRP